MFKYLASDYFMVRTPLLSLSEYTNMFLEADGINERLIDCFNKPFMKEAIAIASNDLFTAFINTDLSEMSRSSEQIKSSLIKYFIRLSTRPTPFGLFSGISIGHFAESSNIIISKLSQYTKIAHPDMTWIYGVIKKAEAEFNIINNLRVRFNDFTYVNGNRLEKPNKTSLQHVGDDDINIRESTSIRYTEQVKIVESISESFRTYSSIINYLTTKNAYISKEQINTFLKQLLENEFLLTELRPPLSNIDILDYIISIFSSIQEVPEVKKYVSKLIQVKNSISKYNLERIGDGIDSFDKIIFLMRELYECKNYLQVNMKVHTKQNTLDLKLKTEIEQFASSMCKIAPYSEILDEMEDYKELFIERYGQNALVPVLELLDIDNGLGPPEYTNYRKISKRAKQKKDKRLELLLNRKIITALKQGEKTIEITDNDINYLSKEEHIMGKKPLDYTKSFELFLFAHTGILGTNNESDYHFTVAPAIASDGIGKAFGRFRELLTEEEDSLLKSDFEKIIKTNDDYIMAEIVELLPDGHLNNVTVNKNEYAYQIALSTNPNANKHVLHIRDLFIGVDPKSNSFYIRSKSLNKKVIVSMTNMLNPKFGSSVLRFLRKVSSKYNPISSLISLIRNDFIYCPCITYGKFIIKPETWIISRNILGFKENSKSDFSDKFNFYRKKFSIPTYIFLSEMDNRLLINLDNPSHKDLIYKAVKTKTVTLTGIGCKFDDFVAINEGGEHYVTEIVVPFSIDENADIPNVDINKKPYLMTLSDISKNTMLINRKNLVLLPGENNWLFFKLYGCSKRKNELISLLYEKLDLSTPQLLKYFYINYNDPEYHIRLRLQSKEDSIPAVFSNISDWFETLKDKGLISKITIDSYERETVRYGGPDLINTAEEFFFHNSRFVMQLIHMQRYNKLHMNVDVIGILFIILVLEAFELKDEDKQVFLFSMANKYEYRKIFQDNKKIFMKAIHSSSIWQDMTLNESDGEIYRLFGESLVKLKDYAKAVYKFDRKGKLTNSIQNIIQSIIHMFCNRFIADNSWEHKVYALTRHSFYAYQSFQKNVSN